MDGGIETERENDLYKELGWCNVALDLVHTDDGEFHYEVSEEHEPSEEDENMTAEFLDYEDALKYYNEYS